MIFGLSAICTFLVGICDFLQQLFVGQIPTHSLEQIAGHVTGGLVAGIPGGPGGPGGPDGPAGPAAPGSPGLPIAPMAPIAPCAPLGP